MRNRTLLCVGLTGLLALLVACSASGSLPPPATPEQTLNTERREAVPEPDPPPPDPASSEPAPSEPESERTPPTAPTIESERALQMEGALRIRARRKQRMHDLTLPLLRGGVDLCSVHRDEFGFRFAAPNRWESTDEERAERAWSAHAEVEAHPAIGLVIAGSAAARAGLQQGDALVSVGGVAVSVGEPGGETTARIVEDWPRGRPLPLRIERDGALLDLEIVAERVCDYALGLVASDEINAFADGNEVMVTEGLMRFASSDLELQAVIAHEIAHNSEGHRVAREQNRVLSRLRGAVRDAAAAETGVAPEAEFSRLQEREADYLGMYYLARAGIDTRNAAQVWRRIATEGGGRLRDSEQALHPSTPERFLLLEATHREILARRAAGTPLLPSRSATGSLLLPGVGD